MDPEELEKITCGVYSLDGDGTIVRRACVGDVSMPFQDFQSGLMRVQKFKDENGYEFSHRDAEGNFVYVKSESN